MALGGAVVSNPMPKKTTSRSGFSRAMRQRVERRVHHPDVTALAAHPEQVAAGAGHPQHVAERAEDHLGP